MCDLGSRTCDHHRVTSATTHLRYGDWAFEQQLVDQLGGRGAELAARTHAAHEALRSALGRGGFALLDAYVSAATAVACAREEAIVALLLAQGPDREAAETPLSSGPHA